MESGFRSPLIDFFRRGEVARDVRLFAARGKLAPRAHEQLALLILLSDDGDTEIATCANATIEALPAPGLASFLARSDVPAQMRDFFASRGVTPAAQPAADAAEPLVDTDDEVVADIAEDPSSAPVAHVVGSHAGEIPAQAAGETETTGASAGLLAGTEPDAAEEEPAEQPLSSLSIVERMKLAMKGTKAHRSMLIRDSNKLVAAAVLSSPKLTESEVEAFAKMANVSEETLRTISMNRNWTKNYGVIAGLARNPKTPPAISMNIVPRLNARDLKTLSQDRNVPEVVRNSARRIFKKELL